MKSLIITATILAATAVPFAAVAAPCKMDVKGNQSSTVDPSPKGTSPGARPASPGTTGAMDSAGGGSFTAEKSNPAAADKGC